MNKADKIAEAAKRILAKLSGEPAPRTFKFMKEGTTADGVKIFTEADDWSEGAEVFVEIEGVVSPAPDGEHTIDKVKIVVKDGKVESKSEVTEAAVDEDVEKAIEAALSGVVADRNKYAAELTAKNEAVTRMAAELTAKDTEITNLKAQIVTLSKQIGSVQDGKTPPVQIAQPADNINPVTGLPKNWNTMSYTEKFQHNIDNMNIKFSTSK